MLDVLCACVNNYSSVYNSETIYIGHICRFSSVKCAIDWIGMLVYIEPFLYINFIFLFGEFVKIAGFQCSSNK